MKTSEVEVTAKHLMDLLAITQIGAWDTHLKTGVVVYSDAWAKILGYTVEELEQSQKTREGMIVPEDLPYVNKQIDDYLAGKTPIYEAEFRMQRKDGTVIWTQDKGMVTEYDEDGSPLRFIGVLQDITSVRKAEEQIHEKQETLDLAINIAELGTWDWHITENVVMCNDEYLDMLGYTRSEYLGTIEEWVGMIHPDDRDRILGTVNDYMTGKTKKLECEMRMQRKDGQYIWTRDMGRIVARDAQGNATRIVGGRLNVDMIKRSAEQVSETLGELEHYRDHLEKEIEDRTKALTEQDKMLWAVNEISQSLFSVHNPEDIGGVIQSSLERYCNASGKERIALWKNKTIDGEPHCTLLYEYTNIEEKNPFGIDLKSLTDEENLAKITQEAGIKITKEEINTLLMSAGDKYIPYKKYLPSIYKCFTEGKNLNSLASSLNGFERVQLMLRNVKAFLVTPIILDDEVWGFIGVDNCKSEEVFSEVEEKMLSIIGFFLANSIQKNESEIQTREAEERVQLMLDATPLCCNLWTRNFENMTCNEEAARLFNLSSQQEYLERFGELSPEFQPCGRPSGEMAIEYVSKAFEEGFCKFEWMHQKLDGTPVPAEITLVRVKYKDDYIVSGYTRDLRELKAMLATLQAKEDALRAAMDEALLSSKAKSNFLANMSHEIRTPMNAISGFAEILMRELKDSQSVEYANGIKNACSNLLNIVNDILDISKIESGKLEIVNSPYEVSSLINDVVAISRMRLGSKPLLFVTNVDCNVPARLIGDEIRIKQILINLLSNAIKFTETGSIALRVLGEKSGNKAKLRFEVTDTGFGIKPEDLKRLFAEFERVNTTKNRSIEGTGLGLAISKQLCEMMGGRIKVESDYGKGSTFTVTILQECPGYVPVAKLIKPKNVLLYESREVYLDSITETLGNLGCKCVPCSNQSELMDGIYKMQYDWVLTSSMHLKKVKSIIRANELHTSLMVFADYGENISDDSVHTVFAPVNCLQITDMLNGQTGDDEFGAYDSAANSFIAPNARVLVVDDNAVNLKVAAGLMTPYQFTLDTADNGLNAIEMIKNNKYDLVFMDHMMPVMDGIDATIAIRKMEDEYFRTLPIIALTANALVGTKEMFMREGMNDFLAKPIEVGKLAHILVKWLPEDKKIAVSHDQIKAMKPESLGCELVGINIAQGIASVGGSKDDYLNILSAYYSDGINKCSSLLNHFNNNDILAFRTEVHALKSTSATIGATELSNMAAKLETAAISSNITYIKENVHEFLSALESILDEIYPLVSVATESKENLVAGDLELIRNDVEDLLFAAEVANIGQIDEIMGRFNQFSWPEEIANIFVAIKEHLAMFDYDAVVESVEALKNIVK